MTNYLSSIVPEWTPKWVAWLIKYTRVKWGERFLQGGKVELASDLIPVTEPETPPFGLYSWWMNEVPSFWRRKAVHFGVFLSLFPSFIFISVCQISFESHFINIKVAMKFSVCIWQVTYKIKLRNHLDLKNWDDVAKVQSEKQNHYEPSE